jgi:predicted Zn-dependent protease
VRDIPPATISENTSDLVVAAHQACAVRDFTTALRHWEHLRQTCPDDARGWLGAFNTLLQLGNTAEAESLILMPTMQQACGPIFHALHARMHQVKGDWPAAVTHWRLAVHADPAKANIWSGLIMATMRIGRLANAEAALQDIPISLLEHPDILSVRAQLMEKSGRWSEARQLWTSFIEASPDSPAGYAGLGRALSGAKRVAAADATLARARARFPTDAGLAIAYAQAAMQSQAWEEASQRWQIVLGMLPGNDFAQTQLQQSCSKMKATDPDLTNMLNRFVSLGCNCEFGVLQKEFGSVQADLLRWAYTPPAVLLAALNGRFSGVGEAAQTKLVVRNDEFILVDTRFGLSFHTFLYTEDGAEADIYRKQSRRIRILVEKTLNDLAGGNKIFVYKHADLTPEVMNEIHDALQAYGPNFLLCVRPRQTASPPEDLHYPNPTLAFAEIDRDGGRSPGCWDIDTARWLVLCRQIAENPEWA